MTTGFDTVVVADAASLDDAAADVASAGGIVRARIGWDVVATLDAALAPGMVLLVEMPRQAIEPVALDAIAAAVEGRDVQTVIVLDDTAIDMVAAALMGPATQLLCSPDAAERAAALALAGWHARAGATGAVREDDRERLRRTNAEIARIAALLTRLAAGQPGPHDDAVGDRRRGYDAGPGGNVAIAPQTVRDAIRARRLRGAFLPAALFEDPAWDMLLDLFAAELEGTRVSISSLCIAAAVAPTTALRWIARMTDLGLFVRHPDPQDKRRAFTALTPQARVAMRNYFAASARAALSIA